MRALTWTTDGRLVSSGSDRKILIWDSNGHIVRERTEPEGVHCLAFAAAGLRVPVPRTNAVAASVNFQSPTATVAEETNTQRIITVQADEFRVHVSASDQEPVMWLFLGSSTNEVRGIETRILMPESNWAS